MILLKVILILTLLFILYQDIKERQVYWFLFPVVALCIGALHYFKTIPELFFMSSFINILFVSCLLLIVFLYIKFKLKIKFSAAFGLGDVLLFFSLAFSFASVSFIILLSSALFFSLVLHLILNKKHETVPLAGYMSMFFALTYLGFWSGVIQSPYKI
ncbi:hypothetical protein [Flavivirga jejuensis]|uniref:Type IV leader peptidase family protein n=1 Tax=Flavivirga jejuensis TaxID=870487 RepID=A0ABT8WMX2_9FLAO|nr:hypothetical protein [Flavivirga jejuensis]MDO5974508.1 hypothetical protein [Flavivirga jejuensis]